MTVLVSLVPCWVNCPCSTLKELRGKAFLEFISGFKGGSQNSSEPKGSAHIKKSHCPHLQQHLDLQQSLSPPYIMSWASGSHPASLTTWLRFARGATESDLQASIKLLVGKGAPVRVGSESCWTSFHRDLDPEPGPAAWPSMEWRALRLGFQQDPPGQATSDEGEGCFLYNKALLSSSCN